MVTAALLRKKSIFQIEYLASTLDSTQHILAQTDFYIWYSELYVIHSFEMHTLQDLYGYWAPAQICSYGRTANSCGFFPPLSKGSTTYWSNMILPNLKDKINIKKKIIGSRCECEVVWGDLAQQATQPYSSPLRDNKNTGQTKTFCAASHVHEHSTKWLDHSYCHHITLVHTCTHTSLHKAAPAEA